jgi:menaquinone-dependent protoporphyrinogen oxidase
MKILAVYGSKYGQTEAVVRRVADALESGGHSVRLVSGKHLPMGLRVSDYEAVVIAASVILGRYQPYIRRFIRTQRAMLASRPTAFISVNGASPESSPEWKEAADEYVARLLGDCAWAPRWTATFSGALHYSRYDFMTRWVMKKISEKTGGPTDTSRDYEFTDWEAVDRFGKRLALELSQKALRAAS